jgi:ABC-type nitrate/sulfonate/bicarbonate transport system ATPase subunit
MINIKIDEKRFNKNLIIENLNITVENGEFLSIIGPSGCGKTTLLNIIASLDKDFIGSLKGDFSNISFMFQDHRLLPWLTVKENLLLISKDKNLEEIENLLKSVGLENCLDIYPNRLSGGMARRVAIVRTFINKPKLILLDEPFTSLDYPTAMELKKDFIRFCSQYKPTVILVTHDISEAILLSNRILFFSKNPTKEVYEYKNRNNQEFNLKKIDEIKNEILENHPKILEGIL